MDRFDNVNPLDYRYSFGNHLVAKYLSENARIASHARVEAALAKTLAKHKICSPKIAKQIEKACARVKAEEVYREEDKTKHDIRALANVIRAKLPAEARPYVHFSATSYDIVDTASAYRYKRATEELIIPVLIELEKTLIQIAMRTRNEVQIGRTHGQHAEPITFGFAIAQYVERFGNRIEGLKWEKEHLCGKFSGAVGAYNASSLVIKDPMKFEKDIMDELGLQVSESSTQIVNPEPMTDLIYILISTFSILANLADDLRHLQRSEIAEVAESFGKSQVGSSTMPHKRNPINFENVKSMWKEYMPRMTTVFMDQISEHQRDLTNSASQRFIPEIFAALYLSAERLNKVLGNLVIEKGNMNLNFCISKEVIAAEPLYILLAKYGHPDAHEYVRKMTLKVQKEKISFIKLAFEDKKIAPYIKKFSKRELELVKNPEKYTGLAAKKAEKICRKWKKLLGRR